MNLKKRVAFVGERDAWISGYSNVITRVEINGDVKDNVIINGLI